MNAIEVEVGRRENSDTYDLRVSGVVGGEMTGTFLLDVGSILDRRSQLDASVYASGQAKRGRVSTLEQPLREVGELLFNALFAGDANVIYRTGLSVAQDRGQRLRIVLRLTSPELAALPWELLYDPRTRSYLCMREPLIRQVPAAAGALPPVTPPLRILGLVASPRGLEPLDVETERANLTQALTEPMAAGLIELTWVEDASWTSIHAALLNGQWDVLHFIGHGDYDVETDEGVIALVGPTGFRDEVPASRLCDLLNQAQPTPRLVVLNSCASGQSGQTDLFTGTAAALVDSGISTVAAMQFAISDPASIAFARGFYTAIAAGRPIDEAMGSGRIAIRGLGSTLEWVTPVLYVRGDPSQQLVATNAARVRLDAAARYGRGQAAMDAQQWDAAVREFTAVLAVDPGYRDTERLLTAAQQRLGLAARYGRGRAAMDAQQWDAAVREFTAVLAVDPGYRDTERLLTAAQQRLGLAARYGRGRAAMDAQQWDAAVREFTAVLAVDPGFRDTERLLSTAQGERIRAARLADGYRKASAALNTWRWKAATRGFSNVLAVDPKYRDAAGRRATAERRRSIRTRSSLLVASAVLLAGIVFALSKSVDTPSSVSPAGGSTTATSAGGLEKWAESMVSGSTPSTGVSNPITGQVNQMLDKVLAQVGDQYIFGTEVDVNDPDPEAWDAGELTKWAAYQAGAEIPGSSFEQYLDLKAKGLQIPVDQAKTTPGALLFHFSTEPQPGGGRPSEARAAISLGRGRTVEAKSEAEGVIIDDAGDQFEYAALLPGVDYTNAEPTGPPNIEQVMYGIRMLETQGDYRAQNPTSTASGAYMYIDGTWDGYGGFSHASDAPPEVQDAKIRTDLQAQYDLLGDWERVIAAHFAGDSVAAGPKSSWNEVPGYENGGNIPVREYVDSVLGFIDLAGTTNSANTQSAAPTTG